MSPTFAWSLPVTTSGEICRRRVLGIGFSAALSTLGIQGIKHGGFFHLRRYRHYFGT